MIKLSGKFKLAVAGGFAAAAIVSSGLFVAFNQAASPSGSPATSPRPTATASGKTSAMDAEAHSFATKSGYVDPNGYVRTEFNRAGATAVYINPKVPGDPKFGVDCTQEGTCQILWTTKKGQTQPLPG